MRLLRLFFALLSILVTELYASEVVDIKAEISRFQGAISNKIIDGDQLLEIIRKELFNKFDKDNNQILDFNEIRQANLTCNIIDNNEFECLDKNKVRLMARDIKNYILDNCQIDNSLCTAKKVSYYNVSMRLDKYENPNLTLTKFNEKKQIEICDPKIELCTNIDLQQLNMNHDLWKKITSKRCEFYFNKKCEGSFNNLKELVNVLHDINTKYGIEGRMSRLNEIKKDKDSNNKKINKVTAVGRYKYDSLFNIIDKDYSNFLDIFEYYDGNRSNNDYELIVNQEYKKCKKNASINNIRTNECDEKIGLISRDFFIGRGRDNKYVGPAVANLKLNIHNFPDGLNILNNEGSINEKKFREFSKFEKQKILRHKETISKNDIITYGTGPFGQNYNINYGFVYGQERTDNLGNDEKINSFEKQDGVNTFRIMKNFLNNTDNDIEPASISWIKNSGSSPEPDINIAFRFDRTPRSANIQNRWWGSYGGGIEYLRVGRNDDKQKLIKYFLLSDWHIKHGDNDDLLLDSVLTVAPIFEDDRVRNIKKLTGLIEWQPTLSTKICNSNTEVLLGFGHMKWYCNIKLGLELNDIRSFPTLPENPSEEDIAFNLQNIDSNFYKYSISTRLDFSDDLSFAFNFIQRHATDDFQLDYNIKSSTLEWKLGGSNNYTFKLNYTEGRDTPSFEKIDKISAGFGILF